MQGSERALVSQRATPSPDEAAQRRAASALNWGLSQQASPEQLQAASRLASAQVQPDAAGRRQAWPVQESPSLKSPVSQACWRAGPLPSALQRSAASLTAANCSDHGSAMTPAQRRLRAWASEAQASQVEMSALWQRARVRAAQRAEPVQAPTAEPAPVLRWSKPTAAGCSDRASGPIPDAGRAGSSARTTGRRRRVRSSTCADHYAHSRGRQDRIRPWASAPRRRRPCPVRTRRRLCRAATRPDAWPGPGPRRDLRCWNAPDPGG